MSNPAGRLPPSPPCSVEVERVFCLHSEELEGVVICMFTLWGTQFKFVSILDLMHSDLQLVKYWGAVKCSTRRYHTIQYLLIPCQTMCTKPYHNRPFHAIQYHTIPYILPRRHLFCSLSLTKTSVPYGAIRSKTVTNNSICVTLIHTIKNTVIQRGVKIKEFLVRALWISVTVIIASTNVSTE